MNEATKRIRDIVYARTEQATPDQAMPPEWISLYVQFKILDELVSINEMLDSIDSCLIGVENEISKLNPLYRD